MLGVLSNHDLIVLTRFSVEYYGAQAAFGSLAIIPRRFFTKTNPPAIELSHFPGVRPHFHAIHVHYDEESDQHFFFVSGHKINEVYWENEAFLYRFAESDLKGERIGWSMGKHSTVNETYSVQLKESFPLDIAFDHIGDIYLLVGGIEFDRENEDKKWQNQYLPEDQQLEIQDRVVQVLIKFDHNLNVIFEHGYFPNHEGTPIAGVDCNLQAAMSIDNYDSVYVAQTFCNDESPEMRAGQVFVNKFNWKCPG